MGFDISKSQRGSEKTAKGSPLLKTRCGFLGPLKQTFAKLRLLRTDGIPCGSAGVAAGGTCKFRMGPIGEISAMPLLKRREQNKR